MATSFIPNSFSTPNGFVDRLLGLVTPEEWVVLSFITRHIFGWQDSLKTREATISLSVIENGFTTSEGKAFGGCGLSRPVISTACKSLTRYRILVKVGEPTERGQCWRIPDDDSEVDYQGLEARLEQKRQKGKSRIEKATKRSAEKRKASTVDVPHPGTTNVPDTRYDTPTTPGTTNVPPGGTTDVQIQNHIQNHDQNHREDSFASTSDDVPANVGSSTSQKDVGSSKKFQRKEKSSAKKEKPPRNPWHDLTDAMHNAIPEAIRPPGRPHYGKNDKPARELYEAKIDTKDVTEYVTWAYQYDKWYCCGGADGTPILMSMYDVLRNIKGWKAKGLSNGFSREGATGSMGAGGLGSQVGSRGASSQDGAATTILAEQSAPTDRPDRSVLIANQNAVRNRNLSDLLRPGGSDEKRTDRAS